MAAGSVRPDPKARPITVERLRAVVRQPEMTDEDATKLIEDLFALGDVVVEAFKQQQGRASAAFAEAGPSTVALHSLTPTASAAQ
jgi:hypothetical protein